MAAGQEPHADNGGDKHWYALYTKPHKEYFVQEILRSNNVETYLPEVAVVVRRKGRRSMKPFFPHYLFARFEPQGDKIAQAQWTPGLRRIVSAGGRPQPVPDEIVFYLRRRLKDMVASHPGIPFKHGEQVRVMHGPFEGLDAIFDREISPEGRVWVFLKVMSRLVKTELDLSDLIE